MVPTFMQQRILLSAVEVVLRITNIIEQVVSGLEVTNYDDKNNHLWW
jgi:hypothetical protein